MQAEDRVGLRLGRQEISFVSGRLVSLRSGPSIRRAFDAGRLTFERGRFALDIFAGAEVRTREDSFDNRIDGDTLFWGAYATLIEFREPGGVIFELPTDPPGFATDESIDSLGQARMLPQ